MYSPDGRYVLYGGKTLTIWDTETGKDAGTLAGHKSPITSCSYSPDGLRIVSGSKDKTLKIWDAKTGMEIASIVGHDDEVTSCVYSPDGFRIVSGSRDYTLKLWDAETGKNLGAFFCNADVGSCAISPCGTKITCGDGLGNFYILKI